MTGDGAAARAREAPPRTPVASRRALVVALAASFVAAALVPVFNRTRFADLADWWTDHLAHASHAHVFLRRGADVWRRPYRESAAGLAIPHAMMTWPDLPITAPPGALALHAPPLVVPAVAPRVTRHDYGAAIIVYLLALAHAALAAVAAALSAQRAGGRRAVLAVVWGATLVATLDGFYEAAWVGLAAMALRELSRQRPDRALAWCGAAALVNFRAAVLAPVVLLALARAVRGRPVRAWPRLALAALAVGVGGSAYALGSILRATAAARESRAYRAVDAAMHANDPAFWVVVAVTLAAAAAAYRAGDGLVAALVACGAGLVVLHGAGFFWHASVLAPALLAVDVARPARAPLVARLALVAWAVIVFRVCFRATPGPFGAG